MSTEVKNFAPYASAVNVVAVLRHLRAHGLPEKITPNTLVNIGVNSGTIARLIAALKFLEIIDDKREITETAKKIQSSSDEEYPKILAGIIRTVYSDVFTTASDSNVELAKIAPVFPGYDPSNQRRQQVALFLGLCKESALIEGSPITVKITKPVRKPTAKTAPIPVVAPRATRKSKTEAVPEVPVAQPAPIVEEVPARAADYDILRSLLSALPETGAWTKERRQRWLGAFTANLDLLIEQNDPQSKA
jgi:hypothetical protein